MGPLAGLSVIEMAGIGPCPLAGQLLADQGADVVVLDRRSGQDFSKDPNRRGKRSVALDLKSAEGRQVALKLIASADALIEGFRPGVMERLGLGPDECAAVNERLVYGRITGWGQEGPLSRTAGHDLTYIAVTGALNAMGKSGEPPSPPLNLVGDYGGGTMFLLFGVLAALVERQTSGKGQVVDAAMVDGVQAMMGLQHGMLAGGLWSNAREANLLDGAAPFYRCYETADGKYLAVGPLEPQFFAELVDKAGLPQTFKANQMNPGEWPDMADAMVRVFKDKTRDEWVDIFAGGDACVAPVLDWEEAALFEHTMERGGLIEIDGVRQAAPAPRCSRSPAPVPAAAVATGQSTEDVLAGAGYGPDEIERLRQDGVLT